MPDIERLPTEKSNNKRLKFQSLIILFVLLGEYKQKKTTRISNRLAVRRGLEPLTPCVTGTYSNQLN